MNPKKGATCNAYHQMFRVSVLWSNQSSLLASPIVRGEYLGEPTSLRFKQIATEEPTSSQGCDQ